MPGVPGVLAAMTPDSRLRDNGCLADDRPANPGHGHAATSAAADAVAMPSSVAINEEGPREGFQIEKGPIATARKVELIDALSDTGVKQLQVVSFVSPQAVAG